VNNTQTVHGLMGDIMRMNPSCMHYEEFSPDEALRAYIRRNAAVQNPRIEAEAKSLESMLES